jgi:hypothetical protein
VGVVPVSLSEVNRESGIGCAKRFWGRQSTFEAGKIFQVWSVALKKNAMGGKFGETGRQCFGCHFPIFPSRFKVVRGKINVCVLESQFTARCSQFGPM